MKEKMKVLASKINMKYLFFVIPIILIILLILSSSIFTIEESNEKKPEKKEVIRKVNFKTKDERVEFTFNKGYMQGAQGDYDLYVKDNNKQLIMGVFTYDLNGYEENSGKEVLDKQISYFMKTRNDMKVFKEEVSKEYDDKYMITVEYSGTSSGSSPCVYVFNVMEFKSAPGYIVYSTNVIVKKDYEKYIKDVKETLKTAKLLK